MDGRANFFRGYYYHFECKEKMEKWKKKKISLRIITMFLDVSLNKLECSNIVNKMNHKYCTVYALFDELQYSNSSSAVDLQS